MGHNKDAGVGMTCGAGHPRSSPSPADIVIVGLNREDVSGQSTEQTMWCCVMLMCALNSAVTRWRPVTDWLSIGAYQAVSSDRRYVMLHNYRPVNGVDC